MRCSLRRQSLISTRSLGDAARPLTMEGRALALWPQLAQAANARDWPRVHPLLDALHEVMASAHDLTPSTREALDVGIPHVLDHLPASRSVFDVSAAAPDERGEPGESCAAASTPAMVPVVGLMITKDDHAVLQGDPAIPEGQTDTDRRGGVGHAQRDGGGPRRCTHRPHWRERASAGIRRLSTQGRRRRIPPARHRLAFLRNK